MCLINPKKVGLLQRVLNKFIPQTGWKIIRISPREYGGGDYAGAAHRYPLCYPFDQWLTDGHSVQITADNDTSYLSGFHIFSKKEDAINYAKAIFYSYPANLIRLIQVKYKEKYVEGMQVLGLRTTWLDKKLHVIVASKIKFIKNTTEEFIEDFEEANWKLKNLNQKEPIIMYKPVNVPART